MVMSEELRHFLRGLGQSEAARHISNERVGTSAVPCAQGKPLETNRLGTMGTMGTKIPSTRMRAGAHAGAGMRAHDDDNDVPIVPIVPRALILHGVESGHTVGTSNRCAHSSSRVGGCCHCGGGDEPGNVVLPVLAEGGGHDWVHDQCWAEWRRRDG